MSDPLHNIRERLALPAPTPDDYAAIRRLWIDHSKAEDARDLDGLIATLSEDCVYEIIPTGQRWEGHAGARNFYTSLLGAFPDAHFDLQDIVIGPQGVFEVAIMTGTHQAAWEGVAATGKHVEIHVVIHFPWNATARKFAGERIHIAASSFGDYLREA